MKLGVAVIVLFFVCLNLDTKIISAENTSWDSCELKFYGVQNFRKQQDRFSTNANRKRKTDRSLETLGK